MPNNLGAAVVRCHADVARGGGTSCMTASIVLSHASERFGVQRIQIASTLPAWVWLLIMTLLSLPVIAFSLGFSTRQGHGAGRLVIAALSGAGRRSGLCL
jgi:hypothetical protein